MGGGSGGGQTTTTNNPQYAPEFRPLATGAANQIMAMQGANPLSKYAQAHPQATANLSPMQVAAMQLTPSTLNNSWGLEQMQHLTPGLNAISQNAMQVGNATSPYTNALNALASGGFGAGRQAFPGLMNPQLGQMTNMPTAMPVAPQANIANNADLQASFTPAAMNLPNQGGLALPQQISPTWSFPR